MEFEEYQSHRFARVKWVKIVGRHRERDSLCISTVEVDRMASEVKKIEKDGYKIEKIVEL